MRSRLPRFTVRRLMVAVAIVGVLLGLPMELSHRRENFRKIAARHSQEIYLSQLILDLDAPMPWMEAVLQKRIDYHKSMRDK
jgi:hypothetical protein